MVQLKEVLYIGTPGNVCIVVNSDKRFAGLPSHGIAWGLFDKAGEYRVIVNPEQYPVLIMLEKDPDPAVIKHLEENWHVNSA